jgi:hypothetical protein
MLHEAEAEIPLQPSALPRRSRVQAWLSRRIGEPEGQRLPAPYLLYKRPLSDAILFCLLLAQGGSKNIKQPHCRRQPTSRILRCCLLPKRQQRWSFLAGLGNHCVQCICIDQGKQVAEGQPYAKRCYHLLRTDDIHNMVDDCVARAQQPVTSALSFRSILIR